MGLLGGPLGVAAGGALGAATGYGAGQKLSAALGFEPSPPVTGSYAGDVALAAGGGALSELGGQYVLRPAMRAVTRGVTSLLPATPAAKAAAKATTRQAGQEIAEEAVTAIPAIVRPKTPSASLYARVEEFNPTVPVDRARHVAKELLAVEEGLTEISRVRRSRTPLRRSRPGREAPDRGAIPRTLEDHAAGWQARRGAARTGGEEYGAMRQVYGPSRRILTSRPPLGRCPRRRPPPCARRTRPSSKN